MPRTGSRPLISADFHAAETDRLARQRQTSPHTIAAYRDSLRLLIADAARTAGKQPVDLDIIA